MNCGEFEDRLNDLLDQRLEPAQIEAQLGEHLQACAGCRAVYHSYRLITTQLARLLPLPEASPDFAERVVAAVVGDNAQAPRVAAALSPQPSAHWGRMAAWAALAAGLLAAFVWWNRAGDLSSTDDGVPLASDNRQAAAPVDNVASSPATAPGVVDTTDASVDAGPAALAQGDSEQGPSLADALLLLPGLPVNARGPVASASDSSGAASGNWIQGVTNGLEPINDSTRNAFDLLLAAVPAGDGEG